MEKRQDKKKQKDRETLKEYFEEGRMPSQTHFSSLIESMLNIADDGIDKSDDDGFKLNQMGDSGKLISFYKDFNKDPLWVISVDEDKGCLVIGNDKIQNVLSLTSGAHEKTGPEGRIGINQHVPQWALDIGGVIRSEGRIGLPSLDPTLEDDNKEIEVPADGAWHDITPVLSGCQGFEIMAGVGKKSTGKYALMRASALNTFNPHFRWNILNWSFLNLKNRIQCHQAYYRSRQDRLKLQWAPKKMEGEKWTYTLQLKSCSDYGSDIRIQYYLTKLWFDEDMSDCIRRNIQDE